MSESYITHVRIVEDAAYPTTPPPTSSPPENKKPRVIVVAVRKSGRVRLHKGRENANGTFSIGKTWVLDDLMSIESFTNAVPANAEEQQNKQRAGTTGFVLTIQKPYYWQTTTAIEKDFFIFSIIKIYRKYTGGRLPELRGFSSAEAEQLGGPLIPSAANSGSVQSPAPAARFNSQEPPVSRESRSRAPTSEPRDPRPQYSQERLTQERDGLYSNSSQEPVRMLHSAQERPLRSANSNDRIYVPGAFPSTDSLPTANGQYPLRKKRSESPGSHSTVSQSSNFRRREGPSMDTVGTGHEQRLGGKEPIQLPSNEPLLLNGSVPPVLRAGRSSPSPSESSRERPATALRNDEPRRMPHVDDAAIQKPPLLTNRSYQRTPPIQETKFGNGETRPDSSLGKPPQSASSENLPYRSAEPSVEPHKKDARPTTSSSQQNGHSSSFTARETFSKVGPSKDESASPKPGVSITSSPTPPPEPQTATEEFRPGLGPMIKKKSTKEIASTFRRAATAANAFKTRPGGAGDQFKVESSTGGDGITGVFQAPSLLRGISQDDSVSATPKESASQGPSTPQRGAEVPSVHITASPAKDIAASPPVVGTSHLTPEVDGGIQQKPSEDRRKRRRSDHSARYAKTLGIQTSLLEGRTFEIEDVLNDLGWSDRESDKIAFDDLQSSIRKELSYVEAGSWLSAVENNDERVVAVGEMMDRVMAECEELDCLLTLYNVELGVRISVNAVFKEVLLTLSRH